MGFHFPHQLRLLRILCFATFLINGSTYAQDHCDSLEIIYVQYDPFSDTAVEVRAHNHSTHFFSGPQFNLVNEEGDTLVREQFDFFGIGFSPQTHRMLLLPGEEMPEPDFNGTVVLHSISWDSADVCTYPFSESLCPPGPCTPLNVYLYHTAPPSEAVTTTFTWSITSSAGNTVGEGILQIDSLDQQMDFADLCLPPGQYTLHVEQTETVGQEYAFGLCQGGDMFTSASPATTIDTGGQASVPFGYYSLCADGTNAIEEPASPAPLLTMDGSKLLLTDQQGHALGRLAIFDQAGRCVRTVDARASTVRIDLGAAAAGAYVLRSLEPGATWPVQRFVLY